VIALRSPLAHRGLVLVAAVAAVLAAHALGAAPARAAALVRTYLVAPAGVDPNGPSGDPSIGGDGRFVAFASVASNLGPVVGTRGISNVYLFDFVTGSATLISQGINGAPANAPSTTPSVSADGSTVAFASRASNLVPGTSRHLSEIFVRAATGAIRLITVGFGGVQPDADSTEPAISADGRFVAFTSDADNLIAGDQNGASDVFVVDLQTGTIQRVSVSTSGREANGASYNPSISGDGSLVSFTSDASNLVRGDHNHVPDVFVHDMATGVTKRVSVSSSGREQNASVPAPFTEISDLSADDHYVVFDSNATNLVRGTAVGHTNVFRRSLTTGRTALVSASSLSVAGDNDSFAPATSADGRVTVFESFADNLATPWVPDENVFAEDIATRTTSTVDVTPDGGPRGPELDAQLLQQAAVSADGQEVAFASGADNLVPGVYNGTDNLYVRMINPPSTTVVEAPPAVTGDPRPVVEFQGSDALARIGLCELDGRRLACPIGRPFRLPKVRRGSHVLKAYAADPGTLFDPQGVTVDFTES